MEWDFSPEAVVQGDSDYGLADFRRDLAEELRLNLPPADPDTHQRTFRLAYDLCHWLATARGFSDFLGELADDPEATRLARFLHDPMQANVPMLGAILQRLIMDRVAAGLSLEDAVRDAAAAHAAIVAAAPPVGRG